MTDDKNSPFDQPNPFASVPPHDPSDGAVAPEEISTEGTPAEGTPAEEHEDAAAGGIPSLNTTVVADTAPDSVPSDAPSVDDIGKLITHAAASDLASQEGRHRERKKPRFVTRELDDDSDVHIDRLDVLQRMRTTGGSPVFGRNRNIAGDLPKWSPQPPVDVVVNRSFGLE